MKLTFTIRSKPYLILLLTFLDLKTGLTIVFYSAHNMIIFKINNRVRILSIDNTKYQEYKKYRCIHHSWGNIFQHSIRLHNQATL